MDIHDLWQAGRSTTRRAWLTNPARVSLFIVARPYLTKIIQAINDLAAIVGAQSERIAASLGLAAAVKDELQLVSDDAAVSLRLATAMKEELQRLGVLVDGLHKNQMAWTHRLGRLEEAADSGRQAAEELKEQLLQVRQLADALQDGQQVDREQRFKTLEHRIEAIRAPAGMATLIPNHPIAVSGTSLVLNSGPYGCFLLRQPDLISDHILAGSFWDSHLKPIIERAARSDGSAIDAGAYLGFHSVYMSRFFRSVHVFEPQVEIYRMLCANLLLNNCRNVTAVNAALYDVPGRLRLADNTMQEIPLPITDGGVDYDRVGNAAALTFEMTDEGDPRGVCTQTIDQLGLTDVAFIKIDTQGSDLHVLKGARATIQRCRPVVAIEYERDLAQGHGDTLEAYYHYVDEMAYDLHVLENRSNGKQIDLLATPR